MIAYPDAGCAGGEREAGEGGRVDRVKPLLPHLVAGNG
jgi:hypothetical protein